MMSVETNTPVDLIVTIITVLANTLLGLFTFLKNPKSDTNRLFAFLTFLLILWAVTNYISLHPPSLDETLFYIRLTMPAGAFMGPTLYLLARAFPNKKIALPKLTLWGIIVFACTTAALSFTPYMFTSVTFTESGPQPTPGPAILLFALSFLGFSALTFYLFLKKYHTAHGVEKTQIRYLLSGIILTFSLIAITSFILVNVFKNSSLVVFGPFYTLILAGSISYAIVKHRLLDIRFVVARAVAFAFLVLLIGGLYSFVFFVVASMLFGLQFSFEQYLIYGVVTLSAAFTFQTVRGFLQQFTDKIFYKGSYNPQQLLKALSLTMSTVIELNTLTSEILTKVLQEMRVTRGVFVLLDKKDQNRIEFVEHRGFVTQPTYVKTQIAAFLQGKTIMVFDEIEEGSLKQNMRTLDVSVVLPLIVNDEKIGVFMLGEKASGDIYSSQDVGVFEILGSQLSVAIQNAKEYEEIRQFNVTLRDEVQRATHELKLSNEKLKELDKLKDEFVSLASHELRTPMTAIKSYLWFFLNDNKGKIDPKEMSYLQRAYESTNRLINLVNDMLNVSRIESGRLVVNKSTMDPIQLTQEVITELLPVAQKQQIILLMTKPSQQIPLVTADPNKIKEVLINLVGNALKFTPIHGSITVTLSLSDGQVLFRVTDTGKGINKEDIPKLFQKFNQVGRDHLTRASTAGTGLGLYITKSIIELHGGNVAVESLGEGHGATFSFTLLPATNTAQSAATQPQLLTNTPAPHEANPQALAGS